MFLLIMMRRMISKTQGPGVCRISHVRGNVFPVSTSVVSSLRSAII